MWISKWSLCIKEAWTPTQKNMQDPSAKQIDYSHTVNVSHLSQAHQFGIKNSSQSIVAISYFPEHSSTQSRSSSPPLRSPDSSPTLPGQPGRGCLGKVGVVSLGSQVSCALCLLFCPNSRQAVLCGREWGLCRACLSPHRVLWASMLIKYVSTFTTTDTAFLFCSCVLWKF